MNKDTARCYLPSITVDTHFLYDLCYFLDQKFKEENATHVCPIFKLTLEKLQEDTSLQFKLLDKNREVTVNSPEVFLNAFQPKGVKKIHMDFHYKDNDIKIRINFENTSLSWFLISSIDSHWFEKTKKDITDIFEKYKTNNEALNLDWTWRGMAYILLAIMTGFLISLPFANIFAEEYNFVKYVIAFMISSVCLYGWYKLFQWLYPKYETTGIWRIKYRTIIVLIITTLIMTVALSYHITSVLNDIHFNVILKVSAILVGFVIYYFLSLFWLEVAQLWINLVWRWRMLYLYSYRSPTIKVKDIVKESKTENKRKDIQTVSLEDKMKDIIGKFCDGAVIVADNTGKPLGILYEKDVSEYKTGLGNDDKQDFNEYRLKYVLIKMGTDSLTRKNWNMQGINNFALAKPDDNLLHIIEVMHHIASPINISKVWCIVVDEYGKVTEILGYYPLILAYKEKVIESIGGRITARIIAAADMSGIYRTVMTVGLILLAGISLIYLHVLALVNPLSGLKDTLIGLDSILGTILAIIMAFNFGRKVYESAVEKPPIPIPTTIFTSNTVPYLTIVSQLPNLDEHNVEVNPSIKMTFSESVREDTINVKNIKLLNARGTQVDIKLSLNPSDKKTVTVTPSNSLQRATRYTVIVTTGVKSLAGNTIASEEKWSFSTTTS